MQSFALLFVCYGNPWFEYFAIYRHYGRNDTLDLFKYGQDISKPIWAGVLAGLIAFAASDVVKPEKQRERQEFQQQLDTLGKELEKLNNQLDGLRSLLARQKNPSSPPEPESKPHTPLPEGEEKPSASPEPSR
jgi:hypothetical protein